MRSKIAYSWKLLSVLFLLSFLSYLFAQEPGEPSGNGITPVVIMGNPNANDIGYDYGFKIDQAPENGTYTFTNQDGELIGGAPEEPDKYVTITNSDGFVFDWSSNKDILAVIVKGGDAANVYYYNPAGNGDTYLHAPVNPRTGKYFEISHVEFCYNGETPKPSLDIEKATNGQDADAPTGPNITEGDLVTWTYVVTNTGNVTLTNIVVTDDVEGEIGTIPSLDPGESVTLTWSGTASVGQYANVGTASTTYDGQTVQDSDPSHYYGIERPVPSLDIEKATNGQDADDPTGPEIMAGDAVTWTYVVTNTGNVPLTNIVVTDDVEGEIGTIPSLDPGQSATLTWSGTASIGQYANVGTASTTYDGQTVADSDPSHYLGTNRPEPSLDIEKATNGQDADEPTGPNITEGDAVTWTYVVTNTGNITLINIVVTDDKIGDVGTIPSLDPGQSHTLTKTGTATFGQYGNVGTATTTHDNQTIQDSDPSHYYGVQKAAPSLDIEKTTNGEDADDPKGPEILEGDKVTWTYVVTNTGNVTLTNITVTDDVLGQVGTIGSLNPGTSQTITVEGIAVAGQYKNTATAAADYNGQRVEDSDPSHYFGVRVKIDIEKSTNGVDADLPPGVYLYVGDNVEWKYVITNVGNVPLKNIVVTDDQLGPICTIDYLGVGEQSMCTANGYAQDGSYKNIGTACGFYDDHKTCDTDPSHYTGSEKPMPSIDIEKATNGEDADVAPGPLVVEGSTITWTFVVTNTGNVPLTNVVVKDDKEGEICTFAVLEVGESKECTATGIAGVGQYENMGSACGWYEQDQVEDKDPSHYVGEQFTPTEPDDFAVCISFKDKDGNYVGDVLAVLSIPGEKDWKVLSTWEEQLAAGRYPCNCYFRRLAYNVGGTYKFKFYAPDGWQFISPDHMEIEMKEGENYYGVSGNLFYLERTAIANSATTTPDTPNEPLNSDPNSLIFVKGSRTASGEGWDNLVDGDTEGWDGTTTAQRDMNENTPPYAIFRFADGKVYQFSHLKVQTDNGEDDDKWSFRQAIKIDVQVSTRGLTDDDFVSIEILNVKRGGMRLYKLNRMAQAKYVKLIILQPDWTPGGWTQLVEFALDSPSKQGPELASDNVEFNALPEVFNLHQNYPNPFNPVTTVQYDLPADSHVMLTIFDVTGRQVTTLVDEYQNAGFYSVLWDAAAYPSGLYFYQIQAGEYKALHKMTLIK